MIGGEHRPVAYEPEGHASVGCDLDNVIQTEVSEGAAVVGYRRSGCTADRGVPGGARIAVAFVPPISATGKAEIVAAIGLHQSHAMGGSRVHPIVLIEPMLVDL